MDRRQILAVAAWTLAAPPASGQASPAFVPAAELIVLVGGYSPGGSTDSAPRLIADRMAAHFEPLPG
jgi:tripartite-type tricarboxylate transporter receptor subunit TctC